MPVSSRPVTGANIASLWGQEVHDQVFAPPGCILTGAAVSIADNTLETIPLNNADTDPGGWHDAVNDRAEVPTGKGGLCMISARFVSDDVDPTVTVRAYVLVNGSEVIRADAMGDGATQINFGPPACLVVLSAGDLITTAAKKIGTAGGAIDVFVSNITIVRLGEELGA